MDEKVEYDTLEDSLKRCGSSWDAAQTHGLLTGRLAIAGAPAGPDWLIHVLEGVDEGNALRKECQKHLGCERRRSRIGVKAFSMDWCPQNIAMH
jgi:uncharacterized protein YgfB (UPF0149 family)